MPTTSAPWRRCPPRAAADPAAEAEVAEIAAAFPDAVVATPEAIGLTLDLIDDGAAGVRGWLARQGVGREPLERWTTRLTGPADG